MYVYLCVLAADTGMHIPLCHLDAVWESWFSKAARFPLQHKYIVTQVVNISYIKMKMATLPQNVHALNLIYYRVTFLLLLLPFSFCFYFCFPLHFDGLSTAAFRFLNNTWHAFMEIEMMICI